MARTVTSQILASLESVLFFFFSSRRRHTRCSRDWSSDVCSSDLTFPGQAIADPPLYRGARTWSRLAVANWSQHLGRVRGGSLRLNVNLSIGTDREIAGPLTPASELANRDPALGIEFSRLQFTGLDVFPYPITDRSEERRVGKECRSRWSPYH